MLKQLLLSLMLLGFAGVSAASVFEVQLDAAPYSRAQARQQAVDLLLVRLAGEPGKASWVRDEILENWSRYQQQERTQGGYRVQFDQAELLALLDSAGLNAWTGQRPALLVWQVDGERVQDGADAGWRKASGDYDIPLLWPLWDLQEHMQVNKGALLKGEQLVEASGRYGADTWLAVQQQHNRLSWRLFDKHSERFLTQGDVDTPAEVLAAVNAYWIAHRTGQQAPRAGNTAPAEALTAGADAPGELTIIVSGLTQFSDMVRLEQRLGKLDGITDVQLLESAGDQARFRLQLSTPVATPALSGAGLSASGERRYRLAEAGR
ncbi:DUF2066 domain-containing protein [Oceanimonas sp. CHS3-5]|uniref:DUF2066 domain-containing protein n=1 Tax=Oceanimonas sp. CHS3-5 TaxID=3068186 RepID=UPI00273FBA18|nr:DUF2066 domain-containing protein [Oceanimonas sp. CHS3-5]MDP5292705.1 DUF2066 domain-containing protein [Oceanimonas sp. CHS3-5]